MTKLPLIASEDLERLLFRQGFELKRQKGSHAIYKHVDGRYTTIPHHKGRVISRPLIRKILKQADISTDVYLRLLKK